MDCMWAQFLWERRNTTEILEGRNKEDKEFERCIACVSERNCLEGIIEF